MKHKIFQNPSFVRSMPERESSWLIQTVPFLSSPAKFHVFL